jgi:hypothetical protein
VILSTQPDFIGQAERFLVDGNGTTVAKPGDVILLDWKTPKVASSFTFGSRSLQLSYGKLAVDANRSKLNLPGTVSKVGYVEFLKKKTAPSIEPPTLFDRGPDLLKDAIDKAVRVADDIRHGRFYRDTHMAFNSPCDMCDFVDACVDGCSEDLVLPEGITADMLVKG